MVIVVEREEGTRPSQDFKVEFRPEFLTESENFGGRLEGLVGRSENGCDSGSLKGGGGVCGGADGCREMGRMQWGEGGMREGTEEFGEFSNIWVMRNGVERDCWRTTFVATKARAFVLGLIFFLYCEIFDPHVFKRFLAYFPLSFRLPSGFFPFQNPIRDAFLLCEPFYFYEYV